MILFFILLMLAQISYAMENPHCGFVDAITSQSRSSLIIMMQHLRK